MKVKEKLNYMHANPVIRGLVNHPRLRDKPFILETPIDKKGDDRRNLRAIQKLKANDDGKTL